MKARNGGGTGKEEITANSLGLRLSLGLQVAECQE